MKQFVYNPIKEDKGGAHFEETQGLGHLFQEGRYPVLHTGGKRAAVCIEVCRQAQPKGLSE